ncbi:GH39 family glycosyl hydrolase [Lachnospiraceae bacterium LCP19S3_B12]
MEFIDDLQMQLAENLSEEIHCHSCYEIIWAVCGEGIYRDEADYFPFPENRILVVNPFKNHAVLMEKGSAAIQLYLPGRFFSEKLQKELPSFGCIPKNEQTESQKYFDHIRFDLSRAFIACEEKKPYYEFEMQTYIYDLIHTLLFHFIKNSEPLEYTSAERLTKILQYIQQNAAKELTVESVAAEFFLSPSYFSKLFKKEMNISLLQYLTKIRLLNAAELLEKTEKSVADICFESGFMSIKQFQTSFKKQFRMPPTTYRSMQKHTVGEKRILTDEGCEDGKEKIHERLLQHGRWMVVSKAEVKRLIVPEHRVSVAVKTTPLRHNWKKILNVGNAYDVLNVSIQRSISMVQREIGFEYLHFHGLFDDTMRVYYEKNDGTPVFNFHYIDQIIDFMLSAGLKPYLELSWMPRKLASEKNEKSLNGVCHSKPKDIKIWCNLVQAFLVHLIGTYTMEQVRTWMFQVWDAAFFPPWWKNSQEEFFEFYRETFRVIKKVIPEAVIGSPSINPYGFTYTDWFPNYIKYCQDKDCLPNFISLAVYPHDTYDLSEEGTLEEAVYDIYLPVSQGEDYIRRELVNMKKIIKGLHAGRLPAYVTQWNMNNAPAFMSRDTLFGAAFLVKNLCENYDQVESMAYWFFSDEVEEYNLADEPFHGGMGLIANNGLKKAAYQAMRLLAKLDDELLEKGDYYFITKGDRRISILLYSYIHYRENCSEEEFRNSEDRYACFENVEKEVSVELTDIPAGRYKITEYRLSREVGSSYDIWKQMGSPERITDEDLTYINEKALPQKEVSYLNISERYSITRTLHMHEVCLFQLQQQSQ